MRREFMWLIVGAVLLALVAGCAQKEEQTQMKESTPEGQVVSRKIVDPVCGMTIGPEASFKAEYGGKTYYFCSTECHDKFMQAPEKYMTPEGLHGQGEMDSGHGH